MFFWPSFDDYYRDALERFQQEILRESDEQIIWSDIEELTKYFFSKYALSPVKFDREDISYDIKKELRRVPSHERESGYRDSGDLNFEFETVYIYLPIGSNSQIDTIKKLRGTTHYIDGFEERLTYKSSEIICVFDSKWYGGSMSEDAIATEVNSKSQRLLETINEKNASINSCNVKFLSDVKNVISSRKQKLLNDKDKITSLTQKISIPLRQKDPSSAKKIELTVNEFVHTLKPTPKLPVEYILEETILDWILTYVDQQCETFERTPASYKTLWEVELRDIILSALNWIFPKDATAETFVKKGKTDIHLKIEKWEILIFECKNWWWEKVYLETIDQLMWYVTWKENYGVIIMFSKNKDFSKILEQIPWIIQKHPQYKSGFKKINSHHFISDHTFPEDSGKTIRVHHLIYNIYSE